MKKVILHTNGSGLWSDVSKPVRITSYEFTEYNELRVYFDKRTWDVSLHGLIYTDNLFLKELRAYLYARHPDIRIDYSEQGMQEDNYVSLDYTIKKAAAAVPSKEIKLS